MTAPLGAEGDATRDAELWMEVASLRSELAQARARLADEEQAGYDLADEASAWQRRSVALSDALGEVCVFGERAPADWMYSMEERAKVAEMFRNARSVFAESRKALPVPARTERVSRDAPAPLVRAREALTLEIVAKMVKDEHIVSPQADWMASRLTVTEARQLVAALSEREPTGRASPAEPGSEKPRDEREA